jgi:hypothetical protein
VELSPGRHRFVVRSNEPCCRDAEFVHVVPSGTGEYVLQRTLDNNDAVLIVRCDADLAEVVIDGVGHPANRPIFLDVPPGDERAVMVSYRVTAPGHRAYTREMRLAAGQTYTDDVHLEPAASEGEGPPPP